MLPVLAFGFTLVFIALTDHYRDKYLIAVSELTATKYALKTSKGEAARLDSVIDEYGEDRVKRGDELAEMGGKIAWFTHFLEHIENPPKLFAPLIGHRWRLVSTLTVATIREVLGEISGDWATFEMVLFKEAARRRERSAKVWTPGVTKRRARKRSAESTR